MKRLWTRRFATGFGLVLAGGLVLSTLPSDAWAGRPGGGGGGGGGGTPTCSSGADADQDGLDDCQEENGLTKSARNDISLSICGSSDGGPGCLAGRNVIDVFWAFEREATSAFDGINPADGSDLGFPPISPGEELQLLDGTTPARLHYVADPGRDLGNDFGATFVTPTKAALVIFEDTSIRIPCPLESSLPAIGTAMWANAQEGGDSAQVNTQAIIDYVTCVHSQAGDNDAAKISNAIRELLLQVSAHEALHVQGMFESDNPQAGGAHSVLGTGWIIDMAAEVDVSRQGVVTWTIPSEHGQGTIDALATGTSDQGPPHCGDNTNSDFDGTFECLPRTSPEN